MSQLLRPFRQLGVVSDGTAAAMSRLGTKGYLTTSIGRTYQTFDCDNLRVMRVGPEFDLSVSHLAVFKEHILVGLSDGRLYFIDRRLRIRQLMFHEVAFSSVIAIGSTFLTIDQDGHLAGWVVSDLFDADDTASPSFSMRVSFPEDFGRPSIMIHPRGYLNKVLITSATSPKMILWNFHSQKVIYEFNLKHTSPIKAIASTAHRDVFVIASQRDIWLVNVRFDEHIVRFRASTTVVSLAVLSGPHWVFAGTVDGAVDVFDLEKLDIVRSLSLHNGSVTHLLPIPGKPVVSSVGTDNCVTEILCDATCRMLRSRVGCSGPVTSLAWVDDPVHPEHLIAGGEGSPVALSVRRDHHAFRFSVKPDRKRHLALGHVGHRVPTDFLPGHTACIAPPHLNMRKFRNVLTVQETSEGSVGLFWDYTKTGRMDRVFFRPKGDPPTSTTFTPGGHYTLFGTLSGAIHVLYTEGLDKKFSIAPPIGEETAPIVSVMVDELLEQIVAIHSDGAIYVHAFDPKTRLDTVSRYLHCGVTSVDYDVDTRMIAVGCDDGVTRILTLPPLGADLEPPSIVRELGGHSAPITVVHWLNMRRVSAFLAGQASAASLLLISASLDSTILIFDALNGCLIDCAKFLTPVVALTVSPSCEYIATGHADSSAVSLWVNALAYQTLPLRSVPVDSERPLLELPVHSAGEHTVDDSAEEMEMVNLNLDQYECQHEERRVSELLYFTDISQREGTNALRKMDVLQGDGKMQQQKSDSVQVPFFLSAHLDALQNGKELPQEEFNADASRSEDHEIDVELPSFLLPLRGSSIQFLQPSSDLESYLVRLEAFVAAFESKNNSGVDIEAMLLSIPCNRDGYTSNEGLILMLKALIVVLKHHDNNFDLWTLIAFRFMKLFATELAMNADLKALCRHIETVLRRRVGELHKEATKATGIAHFLAGIRL